MLVDIMVEWLTSARQSTTNQHNEVGFQTARAAGPTGEDSSALHNAGRAVASIPVALRNIGAGEAYVQIIQTARLVPAFSLWASFCARFERTG